MHKIKDFQEKNMKHCIISYIFADRKPFFQICKPFVNYQCTF